jgi:hypothetical protein
VKRIFPVINAVVAISAMVIVLLGYFVSFAGLNGFRFILLQWAMLLAGVATLMGIGNLFSVHLQKIRARKRGYLYSFVLLFFMLVTLLFGVTLSSTSTWQPFENVLLNGIMVPVEVSLLAVLAVTLVYTSIRMLRWRANLSAFLFIITTLLVLLGFGPWPLVGKIPLVGDITQVLASGGARGILIGVALGTLTTGLRILFGADRPYGGK